MSILNQHYILNNGVRIPKIGFGTWQIPNETAVTAVAEAIGIGYKHIDTALAYNNEKGVGEAIRKSDITREEIFITSKLPAEIKGYDEALYSFDKTLSNLGIDVLDLYLIHAPWPWTEMGKDCTKENIQSWRAFERIYKEGRVRAIGVSNFSVSDLKAIEDNSDTLPMANQIAFYAGRTQDEIVEYCQTKGILIEAYSPLATGRALRDPELNEIARIYNVSVAQLLIRFTLQRGTLPLPKSVTKERITENGMVDNFSISEKDMERLNNIKSEYR
ncbi:MAG: aldo/keto reductase [Bacteroidales bacterium]|jgi:diketogulonate reductase-like aldo/keto reductase|nr:aldo/keto reductase [Bacteroidales bacterium]